MAGMGATGSMSPEIQIRMQAHRRAMQDLHARMGASTWPEQKQSRMKEHMRLMDEDISLMLLIMERGTSLPGSGGPRLGGMGGQSMPGGMRGGLGALSTNTSVAQGAPRQRLASGLLKLLFCP